MDKSILNYRSATPDDAPNIVQTIIGAESGGGTLVSYAALFQLSLSELKDLLLQIVVEDLGGQELTYNGYCIAEVNQQFAGAFSAWIEGEDPPMSSGMLKMELFRAYLGNDKILQAKENLRIVAELSIPRQVGALQLECLWVEPKFRGLGVGYGLTTELLKLHKLHKPELQLAQVMSLQSFAPALKIYQRCGFEQCQQVRATHPRIGEFYPSDTKILLQKMLA